MDHDPDNRPNNFDATSQRSEGMKIMFVRSCNIGIMAQKMEATLTGYTGLYWGYMTCWSVLRHLLSMSFEC